MRCAQWQDKVSAECVPTLYCCVMRLFVARPGAWMGSWGRARLGLPARPRWAAGTMAWRVRLCVILKCDFLLVRRVYIV